METLNLYTGMSKSNVYEDMQSKIAILKWLVKKNMADINKIGAMMSKYYSSKPIMPKGV